MRDAFCVIRTGDVRLLGAQPAPGHRAVDPSLVGYVFHESFSAAAGYLTHGALALAVLAAAAFAWRKPRHAALTRAVPLAV